MSEKEPIIEETKDEGKLAHAWHQRYHDQLEESLNKEGVGVDAIADVVWNYGVLERLCPSNQKEREEREKEQRDVWGKDRDDPVLYYRIIYSLKEMQEAIKKNYSLMSRMAGVVVKGFVSVFLHKENVKDLKELEGPEGIKNFIGKISDKATAELKKLGAERKIIPIGAQGLFHGILVKVEQYLPDGMIGLRPADKDKIQQDHMRLGELTKYTNAVSPEELDPEEFR